MNAFAPNILLIEDNPGDARLIREILADVESYPFHLEWVKRLQVGLDRLEEGDIDVVLLDLGLPDAAGLEALSTVFLRVPDVPIVVLTGLIDEAVGVEAVRKGAQDYLIKGQLKSWMLVRALWYAIERKQAEVDLREAKEQAEELSRLKSSFLASMSHEIRTPLTAIIGVADVLADDSDPEKQELIQLLQAGSHRLLETLTSMLELTKLESKGLDFHLEPFDMVMQVQAAVQLFQDQAKQQKITLDYVLPAVPMDVIQDRIAVDRVLMNLISNALKFTKKGGVTVHTEADEVHVTLYVEDTGIGISEEFLPHLFDEFRQESIGLARKYEGSGLGLAITKRLVELMGGTIKVASVQEHGSIFTVRLPRWLKESEPPGPKREVGRPSRRPGSPQGPRRMDGRGAVSGEGF